MPNLISVPFSQDPFIGTESDSYVIKLLLFFNVGGGLFLRAVITVEPAGKASFVLGCIQTRLMGQYQGK